MTNSSFHKKTIITREKILIIKSLSHTNLQNRFLTQGRSNFEIFLSEHFNPIRPRDRETYVYPVISKGRAFA